MRNIGIDASGIDIKKLRSKKLLVLEDTLELPSGRIFICRMSDPNGKPYIVECTEMQDVIHRDNPEVLTTDDPELVKKHLKPHAEKWLMTVSTQLGCGYKCHFCDVPLLDFKGNLNVEQILAQVDFIIQNSPHVKESRKAKIGFARMGEPALNWKNVLKAIVYLKNHQWGNFRFLPCYNSIVPDVKIYGASPFEILERVMAIKEEIFDGFLHLQLSINSTNENQRRWLFGGAKVVPLKELVKFFDQYEITRRTVTLNFICASGWEINSEKLEGLDPKKFAVKLIPLNKTTRGEQASLKPYANYSNFDLLQQKGEEIQNMGFNVVTDTVAKCEEAGLCCGQLAHIHMI
jgi:23S rRNA (adenine2503-C2)-methyltransferase